ncbi:MAG TPA: hypothetical protein VIP11_10865 [Gemmatimonadaceae bacterium]
MGCAAACQRPFPDESGVVAEFGDRHTSASGETIDLLGGAGVFSVGHYGDVGHAFALSVGANGAEPFAFGLSVVLNARVIVLPNVRGRMLVIAPLAVGLRIH